jgi:hypothetical protein
MLSQQHLLGKDPGPQGPKQMFLSGASLAATRVSHPELSIKRQNGAAASRNLIGDALARGETGTVVEILASVAEGALELDFEDALFAHSALTGFGSGEYSAYGSGIRITRRDRSMATRRSGWEFRSSARTSMIGK